MAHCVQCWDRALAQSFKDAGHARCPTCRTLVRVDFDAAAGRLCFSRESAGEAADRVGVVARLVEQARSAQIMALQRYGERNPALRRIARGHFEGLLEAPLAELQQRAAALGVEVGGCAAKEEVLARLLEHFGRDAAALASFWASGGPVAPSCVCGGRLARVSGMDRALRSLWHGAPHLEPGSAPFAECLRQITDGGQTCGANCDICGSTSLPLTFSIWTCENREDTILHPAAYDVCEQCFSQHAFSTGDTLTSPG